MRRNQNSITADKLKGVLITRTAIKTLVAEDIVEKIINFQFKDFRAAVMEHEQIEISGFGKFIISPAKLRKKIEKFGGVIPALKRKIDQDVEDTSRKEYYKAVLIKSEEALEFLKTKKGGV